MNLFCLVYKYMALCTISVTELSEREGAGQAVHLVLQSEAQLGEHGELQVCGLFPDTVVRPPQLPGEPHDHGQDRKTHPEL